MTQSLALSRSAKSTAKQIADICIKEWDNYGIWPSVAIAQAFVESGLGSGPNLFGCLGHAGRGTESATYGYLGVLQNQYFRGRANFAQDPDTQIGLILKGGNYCAGEYPGGHYHNLVINNIDNYNWDRFDRIIRRKIKAKKERKLRKQRQKQPFRLEFSDELPEGEATVDPWFIQKGSTIIYSGGIVEARNTKRGLRNTIIVGSRQNFDDPYSKFRSWKSIREGFFDTSKIKINLMEVIENVKG